MELDYTFMIETFYKVWGGHWHDTGTDSPESPHCGPDCVLYGGPPH